jgi:hypothetical protein
MAALSQCFLPHHQTTFGGPTSRASTKGKCAAAAPSAASARLPSGGASRASLTVVKGVRARRSQGRVTVRLATRAAAAGGEAKSSAADAAASGKNVGLPTAANGTVTSSSSSAAASVEVSADSSGAAVYSFGDAAVNKVDEVETSNGDNNNNNNDGGHNNNGDNNGGDGGGNGGNGGEGSGGDGNSVPSAMKAMSSWASARAAKGASSRAVDNSLWLAAGSLLGKGWRTPPLFFTALFCSCQDRAKLMTASGVHGTNLTPGSE